MTIDEARQRLENDRATIAAQLQAAMQEVERLSIALHRTEGGLQVLQVLSQQPDSQGATVPSAS